MDMKMYDYEALKKQIYELNPVATEVEEIGRSVMGRSIYCLKTGRGEKKLVLTGAHHGLEYITSMFLMKFLKEYESSAIENRNMFGKSARSFFSEIMLYVLPMVNPDGVDIAVNGLDITNEYHRRLISAVGIHSFRHVWQANARGVDLNHNYNALWQSIIEKPAPTLYGGESFESEPETAAVCAFLRKVRADMLVCFHSQGEEIYYDFDGCELPESKTIAEHMAAVSGYSVKRPQGTASVGGCKDWFIREFGKVGFTVEMGKGKNPLPDSEIEKIYPENARIVFSCMEDLAQTKKYC